MSGWTGFYDAPIGGLRIEGGNEGVHSIAFHAKPCRTDSDARDVLRQLDEYFGGTRRAFDLPLAPRGTPFQLDVWRALLNIPYGETRTYLDIADALGRRSATRAVGAANGANPIPIVIPCHRVIGSNGSLTGFGGGIDVKRSLLALESGARTLWPSVR